MPHKTLDSQWPHSPYVKDLLRDAERDSDVVSMFTFGNAPDDAIGAVVVVKGRHAVNALREWAHRNRILTPGKQVDDGDDRKPEGCD